MSNNLYRTLVQHSEKPYDFTAVSKLLLKLKQSNRVSEVRREVMMMQLFKLTSPITIKAVNNFFSLVKNIPQVKVLHTDEDIASECYIALDKCVKNVNISDFKKFHFYINSTYNRIVYRIYERQYKKRELIENNIEDMEFMVVQQKVQTGNHVDLTEIDLTKADLSDIEMSVLRMRVEGDNFQMFLKTHKLNHVEYSKILTSLKQKLTNLYDND